MGKKNEKEPMLFTILFSTPGTPPIRCTSTEDLAETWVKAIEERSKKGDWWRPIKFTSHDGLTEMVFICSAIAGIIHGVIPTKEEA